MYKTITFFRNIEEEKFRELYLEQLLPIFYNLPGFVCTDVTSITFDNPNMSEKAANVQYMIEAHFETLETMNKVLTSQEIGQMMQTALTENAGDIFFFTGNTARIYSDESKEKYHKLEKKGSVIDDYSGGTLKTYQYDK
ncbi:hypothetical protein MK805_16975 [Shimazuella sp. AN120528]|uniref:hypothetical protein n=1 Tax=Shimazuella soli TaxID=1892854 RepID=UPI001F0E4893|nr:hypothetical protein [Shimazuella soli]MCH5586630.1 hypothetical protein [Shimazuella soli]